MGGVLAAECVMGMVMGVECFAGSVIQLVPSSDLAPRRGL